MVNPKIQVINLSTWFTASSFLQYSDALSSESRVWFVKRNSGSTGLLIRNTEHYLESFADGQGSVGEWAARTAGTHGNSVGVSICSMQTIIHKDAVTTTSAEECGRTNNNICFRCKCIACRRYSKFW